MQILKRSVMFKTFGLAGNCILLEHQHCYLHDTSHRGPDKDVRATSSPYLNAQSSASTLEALGINLYEPKIHCPLWSLIREPASPLPA